MTISSFDELLQASRQQTEPQRLLFVFATAGLPDDATPAQHARFAAGHGGTLEPLMCVDKAPDDIVSFDTLIEQAREFGQPWDIVFVAAMSGRAGSSPTAAQAEAPLQRMVEAIKAGDIGGYIPFDTQGQPIQFN
ncbi:MAG: ribonucleotide reductase subunit alpha [Burkholderiales bacterium]